MTAYLRAPAASSQVRDVIFSRDGDATVEVGEFRWYAESDLEVLGTLCSAGGDAPGGADLIFDVLLDGATSLYTLLADKPRVAAGAHEGSAGAPAVSSVLEGHYLTVDIVQAGSSPPGSKLVVQIMFRPA